MVADIEEISKYFSGGIEQKKIKKTPEKFPVFGGKFFELIFCVNIIIFLLK